MRRHFLSLCLGTSGVAFVACSHDIPVYRGPASCGSDCAGGGSSGEDAGSGGSRAAGGSGLDGGTGSSGSGGVAGGGNSGSGGSGPGGSLGSGGADAGSDAHVCSGVICNGACATDTDTNIDHCGGSCKKCTAPEHAHGVCQSGSCSFACDANYRARGGACQYRPSCEGLDTACSGDDCCASDPVPGGTFRRGYDLSEQSVQSSIAVAGWQSSATSTVRVADFDLDRYEVTVSRFRKFVLAYDDWRGQGVSGQNPRDEAGGHPQVSFSGWQLPWTTATYQSGGNDIPAFPVTASDLETALLSCPAPATWIHDAGTAEDLPITCVSFLEAFAFCIWDGGRLPTEAEWNYAAAGGSAQRAYPWSQPPQTLNIDPGVNAVYSKNSAEGPNPVGSRPGGAGLFHQQDLAGNVYEWVRDDVATVGTYVAVTDNPIELSTDADVLSRHAIRGGSYKFAAVYQRTAFRQSLQSMLRFNDAGFRCARPAVPSSTCGLVSATCCGCACTACVGAQTCVSDGAGDFACQ